MGRCEREKPPAPGIERHPPAEYEWAWGAHGQAVRNPYRDAYATRTGFTPSGWAVAGDGKRQWLPHCYGMVGVACDLAPDTGTGGDLYTVIGHAPRHLDRNIALVGRVIDGMGALSALPRGTGGGLGLYEDPKQRVPIARIVLVADLPVAERPTYQYLRPDAPVFAATLEARANRGGPFFTVPAGTADLCNLMVPSARWRSAPASGHFPTQSATSPATVLAAWLRAVPTGPAAIALTGTRASKRRFSTTLPLVRISEASKVTIA